MLCRLLPRHSCSSVHLTASGVREPSTTVDRAARASAGSRRPDYTLPAFGSWTGPVYGQLGVLTRDDRHAECHMCGRRFRMLATRVWKTYGVWADEHRAMF